MELNQERIKTWEAAINRIYLGALFDIDGTLIDFGEKQIPLALQRKLVEIAEHTPIALCTGRYFSYALSAVNNILEDHKVSDNVRKNWFIICESGAEGYFFNEKTREYQQFYSVPFPYSDEIKKKQFETIVKAMGNKVSQALCNTHSFSFKSARYEGISIAQIVKDTEKLDKIAREALKKIDPDNKLILLNSSLGLDVVYKEANKDRGVKELGNYLKAKDMVLNDQFSELLVCGDQPNAGGNDEMFLNGHFGTAFTVGHIHSNNVYPLPVYYNGFNVTLFGSSGTLHLLDELKFAKVQF